MNIKKEVSALVCAIGIVGFVGASPTITLNRVQQRYPWNGLVDIDYTVADVDAPADYYVQFRAVVPGEGGADHRIRLTEFLDASTLLEASNGTHRVTWNTQNECDVCRFFSKNVQFKAELVFAPDGERKDRPYFSYVVIDLTGGTNAANFGVSYEHFTTLAAATSKYNTVEYKTDKLVMRKIHAGTFMMGSPTNETGRVPSWCALETLHQVTLTNDFYIGIYEMTQRQYELVTGTKPSLHTNGIDAAELQMHPVESISYADIRGVVKGCNVALLPTGDVDDGPYIFSFLGTLRRKTGLNLLDLPTEAQWEYACRVGSSTCYYWGDDIGGRAAEDAKHANAWWGGAGGEHPQSVGLKLPNGVGLYDMAGNVFEWCRDSIEINNTTGEHTSDLGEDPVIEPLGTYNRENGGRVGAPCRSSFNSSSYNSKFLRAAVRFGACVKGADDKTMGRFGFRLSMVAPK